MWLQKQHPGVRGQKLQLGGIRSFQGSLTPGADLNGSSTEDPDVRAICRAHPAALSACVGFYD